MHSLNIVQQISVWVLPVLFAITLHEVAHGWMANRLGDPTARMLGRLTLNPIKHIDPLGTVILPLLMKIFGGVIFGWAKPVPVTVENLRHPKRDMAYVALAGPVSNLLMALLWGLVIRFGGLLGGLHEGVGYFLILTGVAGVFINTVIMVLNLLPLPPLDGGRVMVSILPGPLAWKFSRIEPYGMIILVLLLVSNVLGMLIWPPIKLLLSVISIVAGIDPGTFGVLLQSIL